MNTRTMAGRLALTVAALAAVAGLTACGGTGSSGAPTSSPASSSSTSGGPAPTTGSAAPTTGSAAPTTGSAAPTTGSADPSTSPSTVAAVPVESNPPGDIPDNLAFVPYTNRVGGYRFTHPEGWARTVAGARVRFTDKLNGVVAEGLATPSAPTPAVARTSDVPRLAGSVPAFHLRSLAAVLLPGGRGVRIVFRRNSEPDPVTGKVYRDEVEEYLVWSAGRLVRLDLYGPVGADNVDAYRTMSRSLRLR
jgi:hypothetical protein